MSGRATHHIVTFEIDDQIVSAVQARTGTNDYSAAVRYIIREFGRSNGLQVSDAKPKAKFHKKRKANPKADEDQMRYR